MRIMNILAFIGPIVFILSYIWACSTNEENKEIKRLPRWICITSIPLSFVGFGSIVAFVMIWNPYIVVTIFMVPGWIIYLGKTENVSDNMLQPIQNNWYTTKIKDIDGNTTNRTLRLFTLGGLVPLLPGEVLKDGVFENKTVLQEFDVKNMETHDNTPVNAEMAFWVELNLERVQQILETNQDPIEWWSTVLGTAAEVINTRASDVLKKRPGDYAVKSKVNMSNLLKEDTTDSGRFFPEEDDMGFIIKDMKFSDINWTDKVREAQEQIQKAEAFAAAADALSKKSGIDLETMDDGPKKEARAKWLLKMVQINADKRKSNDHNYTFDFDGADSSHVGDIIKKVIESIKGEDE